MFNNNKTTPLQKLSLGTAAVVAALVFVEIVLRVAGMYCALSQQRSLQKLSNSEKTYRVLCLGESTTFMGDKQSYPRQLERILNQENPAQNFTVINKGVPSILTTGILAQLEYHLEVFKPDMVVVMMGINDGPDTRIFEDNVRTRVYLALRDLRIIKLVKFLGFYLNDRILDLRAALLCQFPKSFGPVNSSRDELILREQILTNPRDSSAYIDLAERYERKNRLRDGEKIYWHALLASPKKDWPYAALGNFLQRHHRDAEARQVFDLGLKKNPRKYWTYRNYGRFYLRAGQFKEELAMLHKAISFCTEPYYAYNIYLDSAEVYRSTGKQERFVDAL